MRRSKYWLSMAVLAAGISMSTLSAECAEVGTVITENEIGSIDECDYELWKDEGDTTMTLQGEGKFTCEWSDINSALFRIGKKFDATQNWNDIGVITVDYGAEFDPVGNAYLCVYGWTKEPLVEYYVVESWGTWRPPGAESKGTITIDGEEYDVYETTRENQPSIEGTQTFQQYWSVRKKKNLSESGTVTLTDHFQAWEDMDMPMGKLYEAAFTVEGYQSEGTAEVYRNDVTVVEKDE